VNRVEVGRTVLFDCRKYFVDLTMVFISCHVSVYSYTPGSVPHAIHSKLLKLCPTIRILSDSTVLGMIFLHYDMWDLFIQVSHRKVSSQPFDHYSFIHTKHRKYQSLIIGSYNLNGHILGVGYEVGLVCHAGNSC